MHNYRAPLEDMSFLLNEMSHNDDSQETSLILNQAAQFVEKELAPINRICDEQGCIFDDGQVSLPKEMKAAFVQYAEAGWMGLSMPETWGGQGLSSQIASCTGEMVTSAHHAFSMLPALNMSAIRALLKFGSDTLKAQYLPNMISGKWLGCMSLTESHSGSDLGLIKTSAVLEGDGYLINGNKIFISAGAHDACENIIHLVLARVKGAPEGIKGLSLFLVPSYLTDNTFNNVNCIGIEEKMGIHSNPTCAISYENAQGFLVGELNRGINAMFIMMNEMRMGAASQGVGLSEVCYQHSYHYASERRQGRSLKGVAEPNYAADTLLVHADVRRMLLTQRAFAEGGRALSQYCSQLLDHVEGVSSANADLNVDDSKQLLNFLTPIAKAFCTETGLESSSLAIQVLGGHGYIRESGVEQLYRDGRIATLYEGTTGIQALDLLGRKVLGSQGKSLLLFTKKLHTLCQSEKGCRSHEKMLDQLAMYTKEWPKLTQSVGVKAIKNHEEVGAAAYDYLMYCGYVTLAYFWLLMSIKATRLLAASAADTLTDEPQNEALLKSKINTASFYFARLLPRADAHKNALLSGAEILAL